MFVENFSVLYMNTTIFLLIPYQMNVEYLETHGFLEKSFVMNTFLKLILKQILKHRSMIYWVPTSVKTCTHISPSIVFQSMQHTEASQFEFRCIQCKK